MDECLSDFLYSAGDGNCYERLPMPTEWHVLCSLIVSGRLKGELPPGFLSQFRYLPNELLLKIWDYIPSSEKRGYRVVCKHWKRLWESLRVPKTPVANIRIFLKDGKLVLKICRSYFSHKASVLKIRAEEKCLKQALSLIELHGAIYGSSSRALVIGEGAGTEEYLKAISDQRWSVHSLTFFGDLKNTTESALCQFLKCLQRDGSVIEFFSFSDAEVNEDLITDQLIALIPPTVKELIIGISPNCLERVKKLHLTDASLTHLLKHERVVVLPPCHFTHDGIENTLKEYFRSCYARAASSVGGCIFFPAHFNFLSCGSVDANVLASIRMEGVETTFSRPVWVIYKSANKQYFNEEDACSPTVGNVEFFASSEGLQASVDVIVTSLETYKQLISKYRPEDYRTRTPRTSIGMRSYTAAEFSEDDYDDEGRYVPHLMN